MKQTLLLGAHMSAAGGLYKALEAGQSIGCTAIQLFTHSNRQWKIKPLEEVEIELFKKTWKTTNIQAVMVHASYLLNIGSPQKEFYLKSVETLEQELIRCEQLAIPYLIIHPGAYLNDTLENCLQRISDTLNLIFEKVPGKTKIVLENTAGQGTVVGYNFEHLAFIIEKVTHKNRLGICVDTCHAFAAGYRFLTPEEYKEFWKNFDTVIGLKYLKAFHFNDSKKECKSRVDRHEEIGKGKLGLKPFELLMNDPVFFNIPKILETPYHTLENYRENMEILKNMLTPNTKRELKIL